MSIKNKRQSIKKETLDLKLKSKLKENFDWMKEEDETLEDSPSLDSGDDLEDTTNDIDMETDSEQTDTGLADLTPSQEQQLDSEVDELLQFGLDSTEESDEILSEDDEILEEPVDIESDNTPELISSEDQESADLMTAEDEYEAEPVTDFIDTDELQDIIDSPDSLGALETELVNDVTSEDSGDDMDDMGLEENEDPFKGLSKLNGFEQGYEGEDIQDELMEDVDLASELRDLEFGIETKPLNDKTPSSVSSGNVKGGADSNVSDVSFKPSSPAQVMSESIKKSKMLVKAAAAILKLKKMQESAYKEANKLKFENSKLAKVNAILAVAGDKMTKDVRKKIVESFHACNSKNEVSKLYGKIVNVIKESQNPTVKKVINNAKTSKVKTVAPIKESTEKKVTNQTSQVSREQMRKNYLMGFKTETDMYFDN